MRLILDREATRTSILEGLQWLESEVTRPTDVGVVFLSGQATIDSNRNYWFVPSEADASKIRTTGVSQDDIRRTLRVLPGRVLFFLNTGVGLPNIQDIVVKDFSAPENGIVVFVSTRPRSCRLKARRGTTVLSRMPLSRESI
jgi:hypothetical protein